MILLQTLGGLDLRRSDGTELRTVLSQPKRLALLTYLALATPFGYHRRDSLLALFWPELDQRHARNALSRALYSLRQALGDEVIVGRGDEELRLSETQIECDARSFETAIDAGELSRAMTLYHGDLLQGFFLSDAAPFERWLEDRRSGLRTRAVSAALRLAEAEEQAGNSEGAERWVQRALTSSPYEESALIRLMQVLERRGDRAQAVLAYEHFANRLRVDLGVEPSGHARALINGWRTAILVDASQKRRLSENSETLAEAIPFRATPTPRPEPRPRWTDRRRFVLAVILLVGCMWILEPRGMGWTGDAVTSPGTTIAVLPFTVHAQTSDHDFLREGMVDILSAKLNSAVGVHSIDPAALLQATAVPTAGPVSPTEGRGLARRFGARFYVLGRVVVIGNRIQITATIYDDRTDAGPVTRAVVSASDGNLFTVVDDLAAELLSGLGATSERMARVASITTQSPAALRAYLDGEQSFRKANFARLDRLTEALKAFSEAVRLDSSFALAHYRLAVVAGWADSLELARRATAQAVRYRARLPTYYRLLVEGLDADFSGDGRRAIAAYRASVAAHPEDAEAWVRLGNVTAIYAPLLGQTSSDMWNAFATAARYDPRNPVPWMYLSHLAALDDDFRGLDTLLVRAYPHGIPSFWRAITALRQGDRSEVRQVFANLDPAESWQRSYAALLIAQFLGDGETAREIAAAAARSARGSDWYAEAERISSQVALAAGRPRTALQILQNLETVDAGSAAEYRALIVAWPVQPGSRSQLQVARAALRNVTDLPSRPSPIFGTPSTEGSRVIRLYLSGMLSARLGDRIDALRHVKALSQIPTSPTLGSLANDLSLFLQAETRVLLDSALTDAVRLVSAARLQIPPHVLKANRAVYSLLARQRFLQAQWLQETHLETDALQWYGSLGRPDHVFDVPFLGAASLMAARIHEGRGQVEEAGREYVRCTTLWRNSEPELGRLVNDARTGVARLKS